MTSLFKSRKFWIAVFGVVQAIVLHYLSVPDDIWQAIVGLCMVLIGGIAYEDGASKSRLGAAIEFNYAVEQDEAPVK